MVTVVNLQDGPRTYALDGGTGLHLPGKHKNAVYPTIPKSKVNGILAKAEKKGLIRIVDSEGGGSSGTGNAESNVD
jgi:hypothetical protein